MYSHIVILFVLLAITMPTASLSDKEIETIKKMVDKELVTREADLLKQKKSDIPDDRNEIVRPLGGQRKTTAKPTPPVSATARPTRKTRSTIHPDTNLQESIDNCIDMIDSDVCLKAIEDDGDCSQKHMEDFCEKSCGYCGASAHPVDCSKSMYGCCDDMLTPKQDPFGTTCPVCQDNVPELCEPHINDCNEVGMVGNWMRLNCQKTCEVCISKEKLATPKPVECNDDKENKKYCPSWKSAGLCDVLKDMMTNYCSKTCGFCKSS